MNERIRLLADNATHYANGVCDADANADWYETRDQKFAELIVKECVRVCDKQTTNWKGAAATAFGDGLEFCISGIKEHFGIQDLTTEELSKDADEWYEKLLWEEKE